ncbi:acyltransferase [Paenibacillus sp. GSMTC-2017]|uniref:acyltransferase family protein n=1 Tax=Paenibacillus sp. GSMTC-2017 TaxID=2794350 RepID=UPI0018D80C85|nr:acyltransferase [Paenibacillus sp. GSMTC-2017]MBH5316858.1 acyltransferase [Paenibacillus sp. GSMTC-2017]
MQTNKRLDQLDSIRGLAATSVVLAHISILIPSSLFLDNLNKTPLHLFWLGHESVILFFVLSGFVLSLPYLNNNAPTYTTYIIRRICRILIPSCVSLIIVLALIYLLSPNGISSISQWGNDIWRDPISISMILNHIFLLTEFNTMTLNPVIWSLVHEMRISILFPFIVCLIVKGNFVKNTAIILSIPILFFVGYYVCLKLFSYDITAFSGGYSSYLLTPHYIAFFLLGALLAKFQVNMKKIYNKMTLPLKIIMLLLALILYMYNWLVLPNIAILHMFILNDWAIAGGCVLFIFFGLHSSTIKNLLLLKPVHYVGKFSYSLYLYHMPTMLVSLYALQGAMPIWLILTIAFVLSFIVSAIMYHLVELPSVKLGRYLTSRNKPIRENMSNKTTVSMKNIQR